MNFYFPKQFANIAILTYIAALLVISVVYLNSAMYWYWMLFGIIEVVSFFYFSNVLSKQWISVSGHAFKRRLLTSAILIRFAVMVFLYWFFTYMNGEPFMFAAADAKGYHETAQWFCEYWREGAIFNFIFNVYDSDISDLGYPFYLSFIYLISGESIFFARLLKVIWSSLTCLFVYKIAQRHFGEYVARMAAIFCMLMPNLIYYCGVHLKETEMTFLLMAFVERADYVISTRRYNIGSFFAVLLLGLSLFFFRTVLGAAAVFSFAFALVFTNQRVANLGKRWLMIIAVAMVALYMLGGRISLEVERVWEGRDVNQAIRLEDRSRKGNYLAKYAGAAIFAPMIFTLPFPTMVETEGQETSRLIHGGNVVKNIMSGCIIFSIFVFIMSGIARGNVWRGEWREHLFIEAMLISYLGIIALSAFAHAERFHMPMIPLEMLFAAVGINRMTGKYRRFFQIWCVIMFVAIVAWNWFKLKGRGLA